MYVSDQREKGSHRGHGKHETRLTPGRDYTDYDGFHGGGPLRDPYTPTPTPYAPRLMPYD